MEKGSEELLSKMRELAEESRGKPPCVRCGRPWSAHQEVAGVGRVCPVAAITYLAPPVHIDGAVPVGDRS